MLTCKQGVSQLLKIVRIGIPFFVMLLSIYIVFSKNDGLALFAIVCVGIALLVAGISAVSLSEVL